MKDINDKSESSRDSKMIELPDIISSSEENSESSGRNRKNTLSGSMRSSVRREKYTLFKNKTKYSSNDLSEEDEDTGIGKACCSIFPPEFFSFNVLFYILIFLLLISGCLNNNYFSLPYVIFAILLCFLSNIPEQFILYPITYYLRFLVFPLVSIYSLVILIYKIYQIGKVMDQIGYEDENKDFLLNIGIYYILENKTKFYLCCTIGPEIVIFIYSFIFSMLIIMSEILCALESSVCYDIEESYYLITPKILRSRLFLLYTFLLCFTYFNPSYLSLSSIIIIQLCIGIITIASKKLLEKKYLVIKIIIYLMQLIFSGEIILDNILKINKFQINYLVNQDEKLFHNNYTCDNAENVWRKIGINCTYDIPDSQKWITIIGYLFNILSFLSLENLIRYFANISISADGEKESNENIIGYVDEYEEISFIARKIKNLLSFLLFYIEKKVVISHLCRLFAIVHMYYCQNIYSIFVFIWLFFSFISSNIGSLENYCNYILIPILIISSLCYNICLYIFDGNITKEKYERDIYTFFGLKKANNYFNITLICCHVFFILIIVFASSIQRERKNENNEKKENSSLEGRKSYFNKITLGRQDTTKSKANLLNLGDVGFENQLKKMIDTNYNKNEKLQKFDLKYKDLTLINILKKKILENIDVINLSIVYFVAVSSINIVHLILVIVIIINIMATIKINEYKKNGYFTIDLQTRVTKITLIIIQLSFFFEFLVDLMKCFFFYGKDEKQLLEIAKVMKFILNYNEEEDGKSSEILLFFITYCYYFEYKIFIIKNEKTKHVELKELLQNDKITFYRYIKVYFRYFFYIYKGFINILQQIFIWFLIMGFIFLFCYFELNFFFAIKLGLFLTVVILFLRIIQKTINDGLDKNERTKIDDRSYTIILWSFLIFCVINTILVYIYQFLRHEFLYSLIKDTFLVSKRIENFGFRKYTGKLYIKLIPHFAANFLSVLFLSEMDDFRKVKQKENKYLKYSSIYRKNMPTFTKKKTIDASKLQEKKNLEKNSSINLSNTLRTNPTMREENKEKENKIEQDIITNIRNEYSINNNEDYMPENLETENIETEINEEDNQDEENNKIIEPNYSEMYDNCRNRIASLKFTLFWSNFILFFTKIYWMFLFLIICILFNSYYFSLSMVFYIIIFGLTFIIMFRKILYNLRKYYSNTKKVFDHTEELVKRININRNYREISFKFLVTYSFILFFLYYLYGIFDISMKKCNPSVFMGCDNEEETESKEYSEDTFWTRNNNLIKSISYVFGIYYNTDKEGIISVAWVHLFLCFLFCFDVYIQQIENYCNKIKTQSIKELDEKTLESLQLRQKSLESQADILMNPKSKIIKNTEEENISTAIVNKPLRNQIGEKLVENLSEMVKMYNLYILTKLRDKEKSKLMSSLKFIFEEIIIIVLISDGIRKLNIWTIIYFSISLYFIFSKKSLKKFYIFYCFEMLFIIIQTIIFVTNMQKSTLPRINEDEDIFTLIKNTLNIPYFNPEDNLGLFYFYGIGVNRDQINTIYYDFVLTVFLHIYLDTFSYSNYSDEQVNDNLSKPFVKGNPFYDVLINHPSLKNRDITISKKDFIEIKNIFKANTFIDVISVNVIKYGDFYDALQKLKIIQDSENMILNDNDENNFEKQKFLKKLTRKTQQIFDSLDFFKNMLYMSSHNFILIIIITISMMIPGIISMIYIFISANYLIKSSSLVKGRKYTYVHFTKYIRIIILIDISLQLFSQLIIGEKLNYFFNVLGFNNLIEFEDNKVNIHLNELSFVIAKGFTFFFISLQILLYSSSDYFEYYFIHLVTLTVNLNKTSKINAFKFNNERIKVMDKSLSLKEDAYNTMFELQSQLEEWRSFFTSKNSEKKENIINDENSSKGENDKKGEYVDEEEAKKTIKGWIMDKPLIKIYEYIHKYSSPYQNLGNNEMCELEKDIIQGNTKPLTYIEFLVDIYLDALSPFKLTEQGLKIVGSMFNGSRESHIEELKKMQEQLSKDKIEANMKYDNLTNKVEELRETITNIDNKIELLEEQIKEDSNEEINDFNINLDGLGIINNNQKDFEEEESKTNVLITENSPEVGNSSKKEYKNINEKERVLNNYKKAKKILEKEEQKIRNKMLKFEEIKEREKKHDKNKYLDDDIIENSKSSKNVVKKEIKKIDISDEKFQKFERLQTKTLLFTRYLKNNFIFSCILLDLKSCLSYNFHWFCYGIMLIDHMVASSLTSLVYPISIFCYALLEYSRPKKIYWKLCLYYTFIILSIKLIFSLKIFLLFIEEEKYKNILDILNRYKIGFKYFENTFNKEFFGYIFYDILIIISLMININILVINGIWDKREQEIESIYAAMERVSVSNSIEVTDLTIKEFNDEFLLKEKMVHDGKKHKEKDALNRRGYRASILESSIKKGTFLKQRKRKNIKIGSFEEDEENQDNKEIKRSYFENLIPKNRNEKPGKEYYPIYTGAMIIILVYILVFFNYMIKDENFGKMDLDVQQFNGLMVIYFLIHVIILIADRSIILLQNRNNNKYSYYLYNKNDFNSVKLIHEFRKKSEEEKKEYFYKNVIKVEDELIELYPKSKRWQNSSLVIPIQHFSKLRDEYSFCYKQKETFNIPLFCKYLLHIFIVIFIHSIVFIYFPLKGNLNLGNEIFCQEGEECNDFGNNPSLIIFYIIYLCYMIPSALQIKYGFLDMKKKSLLKRTDSGINNFFLEVFQRVPFLNEIKNIYDWTLTGTCLDLEQWILFESIYDTIYGNYCDGGDDEALGKKINNATKAKTGGVLSFILITALIGPMFIFSSLNPTNIPNSLTNAKLKVDLSFNYANNVAKKYTLFSNDRPELITEITDKDLNLFNYTKSVKTRSFPQNRIQNVKFYDTSDKNWDLVLPHIQSISHDLNITDPGNAVKTIDLIIETGFTRPLPAEAQTVSDEIMINIYDKSIHNSTSEGVIQSLNLSNALVKCFDTDLNFDKIFTPSRKLSSSTEPLIFEDVKYFMPLGIQIGFRGCDNSTGVNNYLQTYFTLREIIYNGTNSTTEPMSFHVFSETISPTTSTYSVFAFYTAVILVFGEYVRDFCSGEPEKVMLSQMPEPEKLVHLCEGINIARNTSDFKMEKKLYYILIEFLREPTYLREITKSSVEKFEEQEEESKYITTDDID